MTRDPHAGALRDSDATVRAAVLATLAHLALNDMIKARGGGVAEVALLVVDGDDTIRRRARAFFEELHKKSTAQSSPIYNLLPDVVSRLSAARRGPVTPCVEIKILRRIPRHRRDACSTAWRYRFLTARPSSTRRTG